MKLDYINLDKVAKEPVLLYIVIPITLFPIFVFLFDGFMKIAIYTFITSLFIYSNIVYIYYYLLFISSSLIIALIWFLVIIFSSYKESIDLVIIILFLLIFPILIIYMAHHFASYNITPLNINRISFNNEIETLKLTRRQKNRLYMLKPNESLLVVIFLFIVAFASYFTGKYFSIFQLNNGFLSSILALVIIVPSLIIAKYLGEQIQRVYHFTREEEKNINISRSCLYLRPFYKDNLKTSHFLFNTRIEEILSKEIADFCDFISINNPKHKIPYLGSKKINSSDSAWKKMVIEYIIKSKFIIVLYEPTEYLEWEVDQIIKNGRIDDTIFLFQNSSSKHYLVDSIIKKISSTSEENINIKEKESIMALVKEKSEILLFYSRRKINESSTYGAIINIFVCILSNREKN